MGSCSCDDADVVTVLKSKTVKARKQHKCYECGKVINPGDQYHYLAGVSCGDMYRQHTCLFCRHVFEDLMSMGYCVHFGGLWETVGEIERGDL